MSVSKTVSCKEEDFLEQDPPIRGQNFVCLSFISPEDMILKKEAFFFQKYVESMSKDLSSMLDALANKYPDDTDGINSIRERYASVFDASVVHTDYQNYVASNPDLESQYHSENEFQTSIRGIKVRGCYDSLKEAQARSEVLKRRDNNKFNIFIAQVGCWCPWAPNPSELEDQEYAETQLNTMVKQYKTNVAQRESYYEQRKDDLMKKALLQNERVKKENEIDASKPAFTVEVIKEDDVPEDQRIEKDPWLQQKEGQ